ncbi:MAG TPA: DUF1440 domain-containing protein [Chloroflexota bacterium]|jgi:uncharacterized membrane protein YagU involved in acid resistance|nr:DUF1440 domain-containing protein [Chloroflexota bacterium]
MSPSPSPLEAVVKGALAGALATVVSYSTSRVLFGPLAPPELRARRGPPAPHRLVQKLATGVFETELTREQEQAWVWVVHFSYGAAWGVVYALLQSSLRLPVLLFGPLYGGLVWAIGHCFLLPWTKIALPAAQQPRAIAQRWLCVNVVWGLANAVCFARLVPARPAVESA